VQRREQFARARTLVLQAEHIVDKIGQAVAPFADNDWRDWRLRQAKRRLDEVHGALERLMNDLQDELLLQSQPEGQRIDPQK
jgi:hypothetical protein